ncbi:MAG TPA: DinB family protein [Ignavibacteria bacterium]|jgi:uncharacterized damage-inducible protein DinB
MTIKELLLEQFASTHNQVTWFVPINDALSGLTAAQASLQIEGSNHSVWQIVNHIIFWNERWLQRFKGNPPPKMETDNKSTFNISRAEQKEWEQSLKRIDEVMTEWYDALKNKDEHELAKPVVEGEKDPWYSYISTIAMHNAYHIGQIVTIRKIQGSWDPDQGVAT